MRKTLFILGCITLLCGCSTTNEEFSESETNSPKEEVFTNYGEFKIVHTADVQKTIGDNNSIHSQRIVIIQDQVSGCMYLSNDSSQLSLSPLYDETGIVKGCGEPIE